MTALINKLDEALIELPDTYGVYSAIKIKQIIKLTPYMCDIWKKEKLEKEHRECCQIRYISNSEEYNHIVPYTYKETIEKLGLKVERL